MAFCRLVFPLLVLSVVSCYASNVPLYMWGAKPESFKKSSPLMTVSEDEFDLGLNCEAVDNKLTVVFIEETLSVEDFSRKNSDGQTSFPYLRKVLPTAAYLPSVENPLDVLEKCADKSENTIDLAGLAKDIGAEYTQSGNFVFIPLKDARDDESRSEFLRRHDDYIRDTVSKIQNYCVENKCEVEAIYTARFPSWTFIESPVTHSRVRRAAGAPKSYTVDGLGLYVETIKVTNEAVVSTLTTLGGQHSEFGEGNMTSKLDFENSTSLTLAFTKVLGYWYFNSVLLTTSSQSVNLMPANDDTVYALEGFSYRCGQDVTFATAASNGTTGHYSVTFQNLKIQPFFGPTNETVKFGESFNCVGYFSAAIWSALLVVFFLLAITFYGIMMMLDIRTMDRFDDPKGKTITINAGE